MFFHKKTNYPGRWIVRIVEAGLIFGIVLFGIDALSGMFVSDVEPTITNDTVRQEVVIRQAEPRQTTYTDYEYHSMALNHHLSDEYYEAVQDYNRALALNPHRANSRLNRGVAYEQLGSTIYAMHDFNTFMNRMGTTQIQSVIPYSDYNVTVQMAENRVYEFAFNAKAGQVLNVAVDSAHFGDGEAVDPLIVLVDENGEAVAADDDTIRQDGSLINMNSEIEAFQIRESGEYTLRVSHAGGNAFGPLAMDFNLQADSEATAASVNYGSDCFGARHGR